VIKFSGALHQRLSCAEKKKITITTKVNLKKRRKESLWDQGMLAEATESKLNLQDSCVLNRAKYNYRVAMWLLSRSEQMKMQGMPC